MSATRSQKYANYRNEIEKNSNAQIFISHDDEKINKYKKLIDKINPSILSSIPQQPLIIHQNLLKIDSKINKISDDFLQLFLVLDNINNIVIEENVSIIKENMNNFNILSDNNQLKDSWLKQYDEYNEFINLLTFFNNNMFNKYQSTLPIKYTNATKMNYEIQNLNINPIVISDKKKSNHYLFRIFAYSTITLAIIVFILICVRVAL